MTYIPSFMKIDSDIKTLMGGEVRDTQAYREHGDRISLLLFFFLNKESRLITINYGKNKSPTFF
jgi:hypothetical protein